MIEIQVTNLVKSFSIGENVLNGITFQINKGERVGILGRNGTGKTTLFKILTGEYDYDSGSVVIPSGRRIGLLSQIPVYPENFTVSDVLNSAFDYVKKIENEIKSVTQQIENNPSKSNLERYSKLTAAFDVADGYNTKVRLESLCNDWNIYSKMLNQPFVELSGGEKTRINLARLLLEMPDILLLDEPTNHLDISTTEWLENHLNKYKGTILTISHDRHFLDRVVTRIIELNNGKAEFFSGNYSFYVAEKKRRYEEQLMKYNKDQAQISHLEEAAKQLRLFAFKGNDKTYKRAISIERRIEKLKQTEKPKEDKKLDISFDETSFRGREMLILENISKSYDSKILFQNINLMLRGGERIALIGDNGTGKSTLIKIIMSLETPDSGRIKLGPSVKIGYLPQVVTFPDNNSTLINVIMEEQHCTPQVARNRLAAFHFEEDDVFKPISALSGGERSRLRLCTLMNNSVNLLILDEPTNHMDIASREWIEGALEDYDGTLLFVSHDIYFIEKFATSIWELKNGIFKIYDGDYTYYKERKLAEEKEELRLKTINTPPQKKSHKKFSPDAALRQAKKRLSDIEKQIASLEDRHRAMEEEMLSSASDYIKYGELHKNVEALKSEISDLYEKWEELAEEVEMLQK